MSPCPRSGPWASGRPTAGSGQVGRAPHRRWSGASRSWPLCSTGGGRPQPAKARRVLLVGEAGIGKSRSGAGRPRHGDRGRPDRAPLPVLAPPHRHGALAGDPAARLCRQPRSGRHGRGQAREARGPAAARRRERRRGGSARRAAARDRPDRPLRPGGRPGPAAATRADACSAGRGACRALAPTRPRDDDARGRALDRSHHARARGTRDRPHSRCPGADAGDEPTGRAAEPRRARTSEPPHPQPSWTGSERSDRGSPRGRSAAIGRPFAGDHGSNGRGPPVRGGADESGPRGRRVGHGERRAVLAGRHADGPARPGGRGQGGGAGRLLHRARVRLRSPRHGAADARPRAEGGPGTAHRGRARLHARRASRGGLQLQARAAPRRRPRQPAQKPPAGDPRPDRRDPGAKRIDGGRIPARAARPPPRRGGAAGGCGTVLVGGGPAGIRPLRHAGGHRARDRRP